MTQDRVQLPGREGLRNAEVGADLVVGALADRDDQGPGGDLFGGGDEGGQGPGRPLALSEDHVDVNQSQGLKGLALAAGLKNGEF